MSTPQTLVATGSFTSDGNARDIRFSQPIDYFVVRNRSTWGTTPNARVESTWRSTYAAGQSTGILETGAGALNAAADAAGGNGFTAIDESTLTNQALVATGTAISQANPAVVSDANNPAVGDIVRLFNTTGMLQVGGIDFEVTAINPGVSYTLGYLDSSGFAAAATNVDYRIVPQSRYTERRRYITTITAANPAVVTTSVAHNYSVGDVVTIYVPDANFGMVEINGLQAEITAVTASTFTTDIDASGFTAFAFPTSAQAAAGMTPAHVVPVGEVATSLLSPTDNTSVFALRLGTSVVGANTNVMDWWAYSGENPV